MTRLDDLTSWILQHDGKEVVWYLKRLSANDTLAGDSNQAGPYIPRDFLLEVLPQLNRPAAENPDVTFELNIDSHPGAEGSQSRIRAVWYNNTLRGGTRNETRLTGFGGTGSAMLDPENTGAIALFAFHRANGSGVPLCHVWICRNDAEEDLLEARVGNIEPGEYRVWTRGRPLKFVDRRRQAGCWLTRDKIPAQWLQEFPDSQQVIELSMRSSPPLAHDMDKRILARRQCEFQIFQSVEEALELPLIREGFDSIDAFVSRAQTILQRRKARSGRSLELHARAILLEEGLQEDEDFEFQPRVEGGKAPDYLFPTAAVYEKASFPAEKLRMLAVKTTCRDRWRQVLNEADRIERKHLLTLQEGVSQNQFREMEDANLVLVVPAPLHRHYPISVRGKLMSLAEFVAEVKAL